MIARCIFLSEEGCGPQSAHRDYSLDFISECMSDSACDHRSPLAALVALEDDTFFDIWPGSYLGIVRNVKPIRLSVARGRIIIFHEGLVHAGACFEKSNLRFHFYLDVKRRPQLIDGNDGVHRYQQYEIRPKDDKFRGNHPF